MRISFKRFSAICLIAALMVVPFHSAAFAQSSEYLEEERDVTGGTIAFDALLMRPAGLIATVVGSVAFVVAWPFSAMTGETKKTYEKLIKEPVDYTFKRKMGDF